MTELAAQYLEEVVRQFRGHKRLGEAAFAQLTDSELCALIDPESNSVAIVVKHLAGNMRSRFTDFLTTDGEKPDRNRDQEFVVPSDTRRDEILGWWDAGWKYVFAALTDLTPDDLQKTVTIRGEPHTVLQALNRQVAHYAYHVGQIVFLAKHFRSAQWKSLSIPRGQSDAFNAAKRPTSS